MIEVTTQLFSKANFRNYAIDERVQIIKALSKQFQLWDYQTQYLVTVQNPVMKIFPDGAVVFDNVNELHEFYFLSKSFYDNQTETTDGATVSE